MIPSVVARQTRETLLDYLRTTFDFSDPELAEAFFAFLDGDEGMFRGPFLDIRLPFRKVDEGQPSPLEIRPDFVPYQHQHRSFVRLHSRSGHQPQHTLVTTGTGSGKTECFLFPILDHCWRLRDQQGVKAILLYPMNALATDQARRLARLLWDDERLRGQVTAGLYVGGKGRHGVADRDHLVDQRDVLRDSPPDLLLTNYRMLDFLLLRPEDRKLWRHNGPETLRYLVLDELHTYDGAQGSDVACLIRRLKSRLESPPGSLCCVGTSATIGGPARSETLRALTGFAGQVFDETFYEDSVVTEERADAGEVLGKRSDFETLPDPRHLGDLDPEAFPDPETWHRRQAELWLGSGAGNFDEVDLGEKLQRHDLLRQLLKLIGGRPVSLDEVDAGLVRRVPKWDEYSPAERRRLLDSFVALVSRARRRTPDGGVEPFLTVQVQLWVRELRNLLRRVGDEPRFAWADERSIHELEQEGKWLPQASCRECGIAGWAAIQRENESMLRGDRATVGRAWIARDRKTRFVHADEELPTDGFPWYLCPRCLRLDVAGECSCEGAAQPTMRVLVSRDLSQQNPPRFLARCPACGARDALSMLGSRAPSLLAVAISHLFHSEYNRDKKLLAFTDSVQDASHRAGFFGARTYKFNLRTAIQGVLEGSDEDVPLDRFAERLLEHWSAKLDRPRLLATLWPADLREHPVYESFRQKQGRGAHRRLENILTTRLGWETTAEYGLQARVGRTLETTFCSTLRPDLPALRRAADTLALEAREEGFLDAGAPTADDLARLLAGLLRRLRLRGGIHHPLLDTYVKNGGRRFLLSKQKNPFLPGFGRFSVYPRFLVAGRVGDDQVFDGIISPPSPPWSWARDWADRTLGVLPEDGGLDTLYLRALDRLRAEGLLRAVAAKGLADVHGLEPGRLFATRKIRALECDHCRRTAPIAHDEAPLWIGGSCPRYRCPGSLRAAEQPETSYYARIYRSGRLERIFPEEHTGLLARDEREKLEEAFKSGGAPDAPNLFVATPTLEMGIDIGDLSAAVLCSAPPTTANYLQRVGRAGRKTGNAFCLTLVNARPHDLYFHAQPLEMIAGEVLPPGCFLDAPEMLKRQLVAFAMDCWARDEDDASKIPNKVAFLLGGDGPSLFPGRFLAFYEGRRAEIVSGFLDRFGEWISPPNQERLREFALGAELPDLVRGTFESIRLDREELRKSLRKAKRREQEIDRNPESAEDPQTEKDEAVQSYHLLNRLLQELGNKYPLNALTDAGALPNYAFPEPGIRLESVVGEKADDDGKRRYQAYEFLRPARAGLRELAPFNTFYADGRRVRINEVDLGTKDYPYRETWRLCPRCAYMERELAGRETDAVCPRCSEPAWADTGQQRTLVKFRRSRSLADRLASATDDVSDERQEERYLTQTLIDVAPESYGGARLLPDLPFGYELLRRQRLREINFGPLGSPNGFRVAGAPVGGGGFEVCIDCGRVEEKGATDGIRHSPICRARKRGNEARTDRIFLYREVESEALRILLPVALLGLAEKRASFRAALELGFRRHFRGDPVHLQIETAHEPIPGEDSRRQFLVVFDAVPGGTGYLAELWQGETLLEVLEGALRALETCRCQQDGRDGCYRCLFAYQVQRDLDLISSREAQAILRRILDRREEFERVQTLSTVSLDRLVESELEDRFVQALERWARSAEGRQWEEIVQDGEVRWRLRLPGRVWELRAQVDLGPSDGVDPPSRPDFVLRPLDGAPGVLPVAVFCDGFAYHVLPGKKRGRIGDDVVKRDAIRRSGRYRVWSVTWRDLDPDAKSASGPALFDDVGVPRLGKSLEALARAAGAGAPRLERELGTAHGFATLTAYLLQPDRFAWERLTRGYLVSWLLGGPFLAPADADALEERLLSDPTPLGPGGPTATVSLDESGAVVSKIRSDGPLTALLRAPRAALQANRLEELRVVVRLDDTAALRAEEGYETPWRRFLQGLALLQFHEETEAVTGERLEAGGYRAATAEVSLAAEEDEEEGWSPSPELAELLELSTAAARPLLREVAARGLPLPELDHALAGHPSARADLAWPEARLAVLAELQKADRPTFEAADWTVFTHPVSPEELLPRLRDALENRNEDS